MIYPFKIFNKNFNIKNIKKTFEDSIKNRPSIGIDGINIQSFEKKLDDEFNLINRKVMGNTYNFSFYKEKLISKGRDKNPRVISIPTIRDKIVLKSIFNTLNTIYKDDLSNELIHTKIEKIKDSMNSKKYDSYIKIDIQNFYPTIDHKILINIIKKRNRKIQFLSLLNNAIKQSTVRKSNKNIERYTSKVGVPQGLSISNILASIYFINFDKKHYAKENYDYYRYVDDILILCNKDNIDTIFSSIKKDMLNLELTIHELGVDSHKTAKGSLLNEFYFLGYRYDNNLVSVRSSSINNLHNSIINIFTQYKHSKDNNLNLLYWKLNLKITGCKFEGKKYGWMYFFSQINDEKLLFKLDYFINSMFKKFKIKYEKNNVKKFVRSYYEILKNRTDTAYIPDYSKYTKKEKEYLLVKIFNFQDLKSNQIDFLFNKLIYKSIKEMEKDIQMY